MYGLAKGYNNLALYGRYPGTVNLPKRESESQRGPYKNQNRARNPNPASEKVAEQCVSKKSAHSARALLAVSFPICHT